MPAGVVGALALHPPARTLQTRARGEVSHASRPLARGKIGVVSSANASSEKMKDLSPPRVLPAVVTEPSSPSPKGLTCVLIHGWPDSPLMWSSQVAALTDAGHRCIAIPLPCYYPDDTAANLRGVTLPTFDTAVEDTVVTIESLTTRHEHPVVLVCHDWGCVVGYRLQRRHPRLVRAVCALDVGGDVSGLTSKERLFVAAYQGWLLAALAIGGDVGDWMTTRFARLSNAPSLRPGGLDFERGGTIPHRRNWPYLRFWQEQLARARRKGGGAGGGADRGADRGADGGAGRGGRRGRVPSCPTLYMYGADKPSRFHGDDWLVAVEGNGAGSGVVRVEGAGHWFPVTHAAEVNARLTEWLDTVVELPPTPKSRSAL